MLKRFSFLFLTLAIGSSVVAGTTRLYDEHVCQMAGMEGMPGMVTMPCCEKHEARSIASESTTRNECCVRIPQEAGSTGTIYNLRLPSTRIIVIHPAVDEPPLASPRFYECSHATEVFLPNLQSSYIRNHSILI